MKTSKSMQKKIHVCYNKDIEYDFRCHARDRIYISRLEKFGYFYFNRKF